MSQLEYGKIVKLAKNYIKEKRDWGEFELIIKKAPKSKKISNLTLDELHKKISKCKKCSLGLSRLNIVPGEGNSKAKLMFIGEGPGYEEDHQGRPFVGRAGQLLTKIIESIGLKREMVFIANIVKCHPMIDPSDPEKHGNDRPPTPEEVSKCLPYLDMQINIIKPKVICLLGGSATKALFNTDIGISKLRGKFCEYKGIKVMPTYHPAALLRNNSLKKYVWEDMKQIRDSLNIKC